MSSSDFLRRVQGCGVTNRNFGPNYPIARGIGLGIEQPVNLNDQFYVSKCCLTSDFERREYALLLKMLLLDL